MARDEWIGVTERVPSFRSCSIINGKAGTTASLEPDGDNFLTPRSRGVNKANPLPRARLAA
jgi:hypothetical protein